MAETNLKVPPGKRCVAGISPRSGTQYEHGTYATITLTEAAKVKFPNVSGASQILCARSVLALIRVPAAAGQWLHLKALTVKREDRGAAARARARVSHPPFLSAGLVLEISDKCTPYTLPHTHELVQDLLRLALCAAGGRGLLIACAGALAGALRNASEPKSTAQRSSRATRLARRP